jgi:hypothetical protein
VAPTLLLLTVRLSVKSKCETLGTSDNRRRGCPVRLIRKSCGKLGFLISLTTLFGYTPTGKRVTKSMKNLDLLVSTAVIDEIDRSPFTGIINYLTAEPYRHGTIF